MLEPLDDQRQFAGRQISAAADKWRCRRSSLTARPIWGAGSAGAVYAPSSSRAVGKRRTTREGSHGTIDTARRAPRLGPALGGGLDATRLRRGRRSVAKPVRHPTFGSSASQPRLGRLLVADRGKNERASAVDDTHGAERRLDG